MQAFRFLGLLDFGAQFALVNLWSTSWRTPKPSAVSFATFSFFWPRAAVGLKAVALVKPRCR
jgi:hypothetical protein